MNPQAAIDLVANVGTFKAPMAEARKELSATETEMKRLEALGANLFAATRTPLDRYKAQLAEIRAAFKAGTIDAETYGRALKKAAAEASGPGGGGGRVGGGAAGAGGFKGLLGETSALGGVGKLLLGGGAVAGATMALRAISGIAGAVDEANKKFAEGGMDVAEYQQQIIKSIPIIGQLNDVIANTWNALSPLTSAYTKASQAQNDFLRGLNQQRRAGEELNDLAARRAAVEQKLKDTIAANRNAANEAGKSSTWEAEDFYRKNLYGTKRGSKQDATLSAAQSAQEAGRIQAQAIATQELAKIESDRVAGVRNITAGLEALTRTQEENTKANLENQLNAANATELEKQRAWALWRTAEAFKAQTKAQEEAAKAQEDAMKKAQEFQRTRDAARQSVKDQLAALREQAATTGMSSDEKALYDLRKKGGTLLDQIIARDLLAEIDKKEQAMKGKGEKLNSLEPAAGGGGIEDFISSFSRISNAAASRRSPEDIAADQIAATDRVANETRAVAAAVQGMREDNRNRGPQSARFAA